MAAYDIDNLYVDGSHLRLRRMVRRGGETQLKLTQKLPAPGPDGEQGALTTIYLSEPEHALLDRLPGARLRKVRLSLPPYEIGRNLLIDALRRGKVAATARQRLQLEPLALEDDDIARIVEIAAGAEMLDDLASELSPEDWELLRARVIDEQPYAELASRLRCSEAVVRKRVSRSIASLRTAVGVDRV